MPDSKSKFRYFKIYQDLKNKIDSGILAPGCRLMTEAEFQKAYDVSRDTVRKALAKLEAEGLINRRAAVGTFVRTRKSDYELSSMTSFTEQMRSRGIVPSSDLEGILLESRVRDDIRQQLELSPDDRCYIVSRIRRGDGRPMAYEETYIPAKLCPNLQKYLDESASLYEIYEEIYHLRIGDARIRLEAIIPPARYQTALNLSKETPVLYMQCLAHLSDGSPLYYVDCYYSSENYIFTARVTRS